MAGGKVGAPFGNKNSAKSRPWRAALDRAIKQDTRKLLDKAARAVLEAAAGGDLAAIKEIGDRMDGKPIQAVDLLIDTSVADRMRAAEARLARMQGEKVINPIPVIGPGTVLGGPTAPHVYPAPLSPAEQEEVLESIVGTAIEDEEIEPWLR